MDAVNIIAALEKTPRPQPRALLTVRASNVLSQQPMSLKLVPAGQSRESGAERGLHAGEGLPEAPSALSEATYSSDTREETAEGVPLLCCFELVLIEEQN